jgi:hypothetical protein
MIKLLKTLSFLLVLVFILSCSNVDEPNIDESFVIEFGSECGWCAGSGFISVKKNLIEYERNIPCGENKGTENKSEVLDSTKWEDLITSFDYDYFTTLDYNVCNVCADGCDEIIRITKDDMTYEIRYNPSENIEGIELLQEKLREYWAEFYVYDTN